MLKIVIKMNQSIYIFFERYIYICIHFHTHLICIRPLKMHLKIPTNTNEEKYFFRQA